MTEYCLLSFWRFTRPANYRAASLGASTRDFIEKGPARLKKIANAGALCKVEAMQVVLYASKLPQ